MKPNSLTYGEWELKLGECFFTLPRLDISMSRVSVTINKPVNDRNTLMARSIVAMLLLSTLLQISVYISNHSADSSDVEIILEPEPSGMAGTSPTTDVGNTDVGGYHIATSEWWEGIGDYIPSTTDSDGDGIENANDSHPWDMNIGNYNRDCTSGCEKGAAINFEENPQYPENMEDYDNIGALNFGDLDLDGDQDLIFYHDYYPYYSLNEKGVFADPVQILNVPYLYAKNLRLFDIDNDGDLDIGVSSSKSIEYLQMDGVNLQSHGYILDCSAFTCYNSRAYSFEYFDVGDFNNDGLADILVSGTSYYSSDKTDISLFKNDYTVSGGISFSEYWNDTLHAYDVAFNDYDSDGDDDIAVATKRNYGDDDIELFNVDMGRSNPINSTSDYSITVTSGGEKLNSIKSGDLNQDGYNELIMSATYGEVYVLWNTYTETGTAGYDDATKIFSSSDMFFCYTGIKLADMNNDGLLDILSCTSSSSSYDIGFITADGLSAKGEEMTYSLEWSKASGTYTWLKVGDIDSNGLNDILFFARGGSFSYLRSGWGALGTSVSKTFTQSSSNGASIAMDWDADGDDDLLVAFQSQISAFENDDGLSTDPVFNISLPYGMDFASGDINNDGYPDLLASYYHHANTGVKLFWGSDDGFNGTADLTIDPESSYYGELNVIDINSDGLLDVTFDGRWGTSSASKKGYVYAYDGDGGFEEYWSSDEFSGSDKLEGVTITDYNNDGLKDYIRCLTYQVLVYNGTESGSGSSYSTNFSSQSYSLTTISYLRGCAVSDFNSDGYQDLITDSGGLLRAFHGPLTSTTTASRAASIGGTNDVSLIDINDDGHMELSIETFSSKQSLIYSYDGNSFKEIWEGGGYYQSYPSITADFNSDNVLDLLVLISGSPKLYNGLSDMDGDRVGDNQDDFQFDPTQHSDEDSDGFGNSPNGYLGDACVYYWGDSTEDRRGCPDQDGDGWSDLNDDFWRDGNQWNDTDNDGYGDNYPAASAASRKAHWPGEQCPRSDIACNFDQSPLDWDDDGYEDQTLLASTTPYDSCPFEVGTSWDNNKYGCLDSDLDGWANVDDVYPTQNSQHSDSDGDGFGDNGSGWLGDYCPSTSGQSVVDYYGCVDFDNDGWSVLTDIDDNNPFEQEDSDNDTIGDNGDQCPYQWSNLTTGPDRGCPDTDADKRADRSDAFPYDPTQWIDVDNDGYGDNQSGNNADAFPGDGSQWSDSDGDGKGDNANGNNADAFPTERTQWQDSDGDGYGDNATGNNSDAFPMESSQWLDSDNDGRGDNINGNDADIFPYDSSQWADEDGDGYGDNPSGNTSDKCSSDAGSSRYRINNDGIVMEWFGCPDSDNDQVPDDFDDCSNTAGSSYIDQISCPDSDNDAVSDMNDPYPYSFSAGASNGDWDNDSITDKRPQFMLNGPDVFPDDSTQWNDSDEDGFGDNLEGNNGDRCVNSPPSAIVNEQGCAANELDDDGDGITNDIDDCLETPTGDNIEESGCSDSDEDGVADFEDAFPEESSQWSDQDGDGYGDESQGLDADDCTSEYGTSWIDSLGCEDSDGDGYSDDGDDCDNLPGWSYIGSVGCPDSDGDGVSDIEDAFPDDSMETVDSDGDGIGDGADFCVRVGSNESIDCTLDQDNDGFNDSTDMFPSDETEWMDTDEDGTGDNADIWPTQSEIWSDVDGDGFADQYGHPLTDDCPSINGTSTKFMQGCSDMDFDGMPDLLDPDADGDGITNDNEMDASTQDIEYDPFNSSSTPPDMDLDGIPDKLDKDADGDGFPNELEKERGSDQYDENMTPFTLYGEQETGLFYIPGEGFKSQYDPNGIELSVSALIDILTGEFLIPILMIPITIFALLRKGRRYKRMRRTLEGCNDIDILTEYEEGIDNVIMKKKIKVEHGMLLRNLFERKREELDTKKSVTGMKRNTSGNSSNEQGRRSMGRGVSGGMQEGGMGPERHQGQQGPQRPSPGRQRPGGGQGGRNW